MNKLMNGVLRHKMGIASMAYSASRQHHLFPTIGPERREPLSEYRFKGMQLVGNCLIVKSTSLECTILKLAGIVIFLERQHSLERK